ncbi:MAG: hypothetical protein EA360_10775 [Balneolaceae bacterium]|nr:MAG: hypothetical protein EA360_10775 [Balneolaceae bacterium]
MSPIKPYSFTFLIPLLLLAAFLDLHTVSAQSRVTIHAAESASGSMIDGEFVRRILGNVFLSTDNLSLRSDSVYQYVDRSLLMAFNAEIETGNEMIWADTLYHDMNREFSRLRGRVIIQAENYTVFSDSIDVDHEEEMAIFDVPVRFEDDKGVLIAENGLYFQAADSAIFRGNVQLSDSTQYLEADSLFMNRSKELYELFGRVYADDFEDNVRFAGHYLYADSSGYRLLRGDAWLMEVNESESDTTHLFADVIELLETDTASFMDASLNVRIWTPGFAAVADTAAYRDDTEQFILRASPILWQKNMQLTGPYIEAFMKNEEIDFLRSYTRPIVVQEDSLTGRLHQMTGDTLHAYFDEGSIQKISVFNNAEIIFHQRDENDEPDGLIELISLGRSTMQFLDGELDFFKAEENIEGSWLPEDPANISRKLENFQWNPDQKPEKPVPKVPRLSPVTDSIPFPPPIRYVTYLVSIQKNDEL